MCINESSLCSEALDHFNVGTVFCTDSPDNRQVAKAHLRALRSYADLAKVALRLGIIDQLSFEYVENLADTLHNYLDKDQ